MSFSFLAQSLSECWWSGVLHSCDYRISARSDCGSGRFGGWKNCDPRLWPWSPHASTQ